MSARKCSESMDCILEVMEKLSRKGVRLWTENGQLRYRVAKGRIAPEEIDKLRLYKDQIIPLLERVAGAEATEPTHQPRMGIGRAPLTFTQLARWNLYQLGVQRSSYSVSSAIRLLGPLNILALRRSISEIVRRHDALRTRIPTYDGIPVQEIAVPNGFEMKVDDLTHLIASSREVEVKSLIEKHVFEPIDVAIGPLFRAQLVIIRNGEYVLILVMDHMISDGSSMRILLRELFTAYEQATEGREFSLPAISYQLPDYAIWQRDTHESWLERHASYWDEHFRGCQRLRFPSDENMPAESEFAWGSVSFGMDAQLKAELRQWCRLQRTTFVMSVFAAYVALVFRWCNSSEGVFLYEVDGRFGQAVRDTIGYFAFPLCLRIKSYEDDSFRDLLSRVTEEYCLAYQHADFSYMLAQVPRPEFMRNSIFNWVGQHYMDSAVSFGQGSIESSPILIERRITDNSLEIDYEPSVVIFEDDSEVLGRVSFPLRRFSITLMDTFAHNIPIFVKTLLRDPDQRVRDVRLL